MLCLYFPIHPMIEYIKVPVTIHAQVFVAKDEFETAAAEEPTAKYDEILNRLAMKEVPNGDNCKIRDIFVDTPNAR